MKAILFANTDWYLYNFRRSLAISLRDSGYEVVLVSPPGAYVEKLRALKFRWIAAPMKRESLNPIREAFLLHWLWRLIRKERPDVVHSFTIKCAVYGALAGRLAGSGRVNAVAGMGYVFASNSPKARLLRPLVRALMRAALGGKQSRLVLQNPEDVGLFSRSSIVAPECIRLIPGSGVDCARFTMPAAERAADTPFRVILAARMLWDKGIAEFVEAARALKAQCGQIQFVLVGAPDPGNPAAVPGNVLQTWHAEGIVEWLGHIDDMPALLASADVVVLPSYYREGLPKTLIEAAACARPLITTNMPGCQDVVTDEVDGLLIPPRDGAALARAICRLKEDRRLAKRLGEAARQKALEQFDERIVIERTLSVYEEVHAKA